MVLILNHVEAPKSNIMIGPKQVGLTLFGPYVLAVEIASMLLLAGLVGAYHVGRRFRLRGIDDDATEQLLSTEILPEEKRNQEGPR
jgi:hypothetical protein